jgi:hypothetical protein
MVSYSTAVNDQITDSVSQTNALVLGSAASQSFGFLNITGAEALGMLMHNAVNAQQNAQVSASAAATSTCARILQSQMAPPEKTTPPVKLPPPFTPLSPSTVEPNNLTSQINTLVKEVEAEASATSPAQISAGDLAGLIATLQDLQKTLPTASASPTTSTTPASTAPTN